jgi:adenosylcobinamide kinase/adenosylcobinamide-phosphate guanylyltransferase
VPDRTDTPEPLLLGSAATPWSGPGCRCRVCLTTGPGRPTGIRVGSVRVGAPAPAGAPDGDHGSGGEHGSFGEAQITGPATEVSVDGVGSRTIAVGDAIEHGAVRVIGVPGSPGSVALVIGHRSGTVLWAPEPGRLPERTLEALAGAGLTVAVLGLGRTADGSPGGRALAATLAELRRAGALGPGCDLIAVGFDHTLATPATSALLAEWGVRRAPDGTPLGPRHAGQPPTYPPRTLLLGAASSGKSAAAEALLAAEPEVDYLPTGPAPADPTESGDAEWAGRIARHRNRRPPWWTTLERADLADSLTRGGAPLLVDSTGTWVAGALERAGAWDDAPGWRDRFGAEVDDVVGAWCQAGRRVVAVGEETGWGVVPSTPAGRRFREALGELNQRLAAQSERVLLVVAGRVVELAESGSAQGGLDD